MRRIEVAVDIAASPATVWRVIEPVERHVDWMTDATAIRFETDQTRGVGTRFECDTNVGPLRLRDHMTITEWEPHVRMGVDHTGLVSGSGVFTLSPLDDGTRTRFTWTEQLHFPWYFAGAAGEVVSRPLLTFIWRRNLRSLKALVEGL